jgi:hypothetical protein
VILPTGNVEANSDGSSLKGPRANLEAAVTS